LFLIAVALLSFQSVMRIILTGFLRGKQVRGRQGESGRRPKLP